MRLTRPVSPPCHLGWSDEPTRGKETKLRLREAKEGIGPKEEKGRHFLQSQVPLMSAIALERLVYYLKREADRR